MNHATFITAPITNKDVAEQTLHDLQSIVITATLFECEAEGIWFVTGVLRCTMTEPLRLLNMRKDIYTPIAWIKDSNSFGIKE
jgi:hypothetical protein